MRARTSKRRRYGLAPEVLESRALLSADISLYDLGTPTLQDVWVDPVHGNDNNSGVNRGQALQSIAEAWLRIPPFQSLDTVNGTGYRIQLVAGSYAHNLVEASGWKRCWIMSTDKPTPRSATAMSASRESNWTRTVN